MGINPTPTNHRSFTFDGKSTREFGVYITGKGVFNAPERAVEMISIPGRDGEYALDQGHFNNIEVTYRAGIVADSTTDFAEAISNFRNWLASREGYCRLTDEYNTEEYRMAVFKNAIALEHEGLLTGEFDVTFDCKPQRYLAIGEELTEIGAWGNTETAEGEVVTIDASSDTAVKALTADIDPIQDLNGYDAPWVGGAGKNKLDFSNNTLSSVTLNGTADNFTLVGTGESYNYFGFNVLALAGKGTFYFSCEAERSATGSNALAVQLYYNDGTSHYESLGRYTNNKCIATDVSFSIPSGATVARIQCYVNNSASGGTGVTATFKNVRACAEQNTTWSPYENICPISGHDDVDVVRTGKNLIKVSADSYDNSQACTSTVTDSGITVTATGYYARRMDAFNVMVGQTYTLSFKGKSTGNNHAVYFCKSTGGSGWNDRYGLKILTATETEYTYTFTATTSVFAIGFYVTSNSSSGEMTITDLQLELGSTPTTYEPYNGTTYTTTLPSTTYGGTLDLVSGVLTVDRAMVTLDGSQEIGLANWRPNESSVGWLYRAETFSDMWNEHQLLESEVDYIKSDKLPTVKYMEPMGLFDIGTSAISIVSGYWSIGVRINDTTLTTQNAINSYLASNPIQVCYKLATPQTYQLTGQQIALLLGENNIFADSGNVTVEYGHNPTLLTNPTWFPSKPLVYAKGYGDINLGNRTITVSDEPIGEVLLANKIDRNTSNRSYFDTATLALLNVGDTITVSSGCQLIIGLASSSTSTTITSITATVTGGTAQAIGAPSTYVDRYGDGRIEITMDAFDFANGTTEKATVELDVTVNYKENGTTKSWSSTEFVAGYRYSVVYNAVSFAGFEVEPSLPDDIYSYIPRDATIENIYGYSTKQITADGYYIDLDIGEAYTMVDGVPSSINNLVTMPSDLPTLPSGDTEVTYDNTITKVEVKPNYWKV